MHPVDRENMDKCPSKLSQPVLPCLVESDDTTTEHATIILANKYSFESDDDATLATTVKPVYSSNVASIYEWV